MSVCGPRRGAPPPPLCPAHRPGPSRPRPECISTVGIAGTAATPRGTPAGLLRRAQQRTCPRPGGPTAGTRPGVPGSPEAMEAGTGGRTRGRAGQRAARATAIPLKVHLQDNGGRRDRQRSARDVRGQTRPGGERVWREPVNCSARSPLPPAPPGLRLKGGGG